MRGVPLLATLAAFLLTVTPVAANSNERGGGWGGDRDRGGGHWGEDRDRRDRDQQDKDHKDRDRDGWGQRVGDSDWGRNCQDGRGDDDDDDDDDNGRVRWNDGNWGNGCGQGNRGRRGVFQNRNDGLHDDHADALSDVFQDCVSKENLRDMRWGQLWQLVHTIGLTQRERQKIHDLGDLADALADHLDDNDIQDLKFKQILQVAHACGLSTRDVVEILRNA